MEPKKTFKKFVEFLNNHRFNFISWGVTTIIVAALLGFGFWWTQIGSAAPASSPAPTEAPTTNQPVSALPTSIAIPNFSIGRQIELKTDLSQQAKTDAI